MPATRILNLLKKHTEGLDLDRIMAELGLKRRDRAKILAEMQRLQAQGDVRAFRGRFRLAGKAGVVRGRFVTARPGFGFVTPEGGGPDIFVPARHAHGALPGDEVAVVVHEEGKFGKPEGRIERILKKQHAGLLGVYIERSGAPYLQPFDSPSVDDIPIKRRPKLRPEPGMIVEVDRATLALTRVFGRPDDPGVDARVVVERYGLRSEFPEDVRQEAERIPGLDPAAALDGRRDFRDWPTVTIDGEKAQDFDDAVSIREIPAGGWLLGVHIADVSYYVKPGSPLDREAYERGTSVYFPDLTLPMLPERLSNGLCSLRPREPRLTMSALLEIDPEGRVRKSEFTPSIIRTAHRMTYTSVFKIFEGDAEERARYADVVPDLLVMRGLAEVLRRRRLGEGSLDFDLVEPELISENGKLLAVAAAERNEAHRLIEEFMVAANVAVASAFTARKRPAIYRVHPAPDVGDLEKLRDVLLHFGLALPEPAKVRSKDLQRVLDKAKGLPGEKFIGRQVLRALKLAVYSSKNVGHYGLAKTDYTHFTSPIRRYPDLVVHRRLKALLRREPAEAADLEPVAVASSERERNAGDAEQSLVEWRILRFLKDRLGDEFNGLVVDVVKAGLLVELEDYFVAGLLPFASLGGDYEPRPAARRLRPKRRRRTFDLGDSVRVVLVSCDLALRRMSFVPAEDAGEPRP
ncbi:MAG TPA: ribonuclease R [Acidobacteriota bacterium]|nr:ribonuclease R [Acidobacteriota bacterium]